MDFEERIMAPDYTGMDSDIETSLRPRVLADYIGQEKAKENLSIFIQSAKKRCPKRDGTPSWYAVVSYAIEIRYAVYAM